MPNAQRQAQININLEDLKILTCPKCKNATFKTDLSIFKTLPSIQSPSGKAQLLRIELITCNSCNQSFLIKGSELSPITNSEEH